MTDVWGPELIDQLDFYWGAHLWPRLQGLSDEEYLWEPAGGAWSLRPDDDGVLRLEQFGPEPPTPPLTTIAWRAVHIARDVMGARARALFGPTSAPDDADMFDARHWPEPLPATAEGGLALLDAGYRAWREGVARLSDAELRAPIGPKGGPFAADSLSLLVLHINREVMAHGAEICLLRDLYRARRDREDPVVAAGLAGDAGEVARLLSVPGEVVRLQAARPGFLAEVAGLRHWDVVRELVEAGFGPGVSGGGGAGAAGVAGGGGIAESGDPTALHFAARVGSEEFVRLLLERGADPRGTEAEYGLDAAGWAAHFGHDEVAALIRGWSR